MTASRTLVSRVMQEMERRRRISAARRETISRARAVAAEARREAALTGKRPPKP
jgi:hypothetical protein